MCIKHAFFAFVLSAALMLTAFGSTAQANESAAIAAARAAQASGKSHMMMRESSMCADKVMVLDAGKRKEVFIGGNPDGGMSCHHKIPGPKFSLNAPVVSGKHCSEKDAINEALALAAQGNCTGKKDPQCHGNCPRGQECGKFTGMLDSSPIVTCTHKFDAACNHRPSYVCTVRVGQYRCTCKCQ